MVDNHPLTALEDNCGFAVALIVCCALLVASKQQFICLGLATRIASIFFFHFNAQVITKWLTILHCSVQLLFFRTYMLYT